ncbi:MAG: exodeoxyribonuclease VII large subunit [Planctomycetota bacterium]|nr:MAG: exodeoxyribonuclease VII large subunit [Planctomycetota bacterium]
MDSVERRGPGGAATPRAPILTVTELTELIKGTLETAFPEVWVVGELSNVTRAASGHVYFTLKDDHAQIRGVIWRSTAWRIKFELRDGLRVIAAGGIDVYAPRGSYQLIVRELTPHGIGPLELAFRQLEQKLRREGLFDARHKKPLPRFPRRIAIITSPKGAAVRDMLQVIKRRWPAVDVLIVPVPVQGEGAAREIAAAIRMVGRWQDIDVIITGRGGGSLEDLWAFNEEVVARAIFECPIPVVSAVGHEIDVTIADLVADQRALTPSEAGERVVPDREEIRTHLRQVAQRLSAALRTRARYARTRLEALARRRPLADPLSAVHEWEIRVDELAERLRRAARLRVSEARQQLSAIAASLRALSPLNVLARGYTVTRHVPSGRVITDAGDVKPGQRVITQCHRGAFESMVTECHPDGEGEVPREPREPTGER